MAIRDVLVLNTTASRAETQQSSDTVVLRGDSQRALSIDKSNDVSILSVDTVSSSISIAADLTASGDVVITGTGSFGRLEATTLVGSAFELSNTDLIGTISSSGQIAADVSGSFRRGFEFTGTIGDAIPDQQNMVTASFGRIVATSLSGSARNLTNTDLDNTISGSSQIAADISGSFNQGFEFEGKISGSVTSTGSFSNLETTKLVGGGTELTNTAITDTISGSLQIADDISGSFQNGFEFTGIISSSAGTTVKLSVGRVDATTILGDVSNMTNVTPLGALSASAQISADITGSFNRGFEYSGLISGSDVNSGSFTSTTAIKAVGNISEMTNILPETVISSSEQIALDISGSFDEGFEFDGTIKTALGSWSAGGNLNTGRTQDGGVGTKAAFIQVDSTGATEIYNGSSWSEVNDMINGKVQQEAAGSSTSALVFGGWTGTWSALSEEWNGTNWSAQLNMPISRSNHSAAGQTDADSALAFGGSYPPAGAADTDTVEWNGTAWTTYPDTDLAPGHRNGVGFGSTEAALYNNTTFPQPMNKEWNGTAWSDIATSLQGHDKGSGGGTVNDGVVFGGGPALATYTELFDGTSWSQQGFLSTARIYTDGGGTAAANVLAVGGQPGITSVEHFSTFISTGSFNRVEATSFHGDISKMTNTAKPGFLSGSAQIAADISGSFTGGFGTTGGNIGIGGVWSVGATFDHPERPYPSSDYNCLLYGTNLGLVGGNCAAGIITGYNKNPIYACYTTYTEGAYYLYNGIDYSLSPHDIIEPRGSVSAEGTQNAAVKWGGYQTWDQATCVTETYNGSSWSIAGMLLYSVYLNDAIGGSVGQNAAIQFGEGAPTYHGQQIGLGIKNTRVNCLMQEWDGNIWSIREGKTVNFYQHNKTADGTVNDAFNFGQNHQSNVGNCGFEVWDGITWTKIEKYPPKVALGKSWGIGSSNDIVLAGGSPYSGYGAPYNIYNCVVSEDTFNWDGISWKVDGAKMNVPRRDFAAQSNSTTSDGLALGGQCAQIGTSANCTEHYDKVSLENYPFTQTTASFFQVTASSAFAANLTNNPTLQLPEGFLSSSAQIARSISGSFNQCYTFEGGFGGGFGVWYTGGKRNNWILNFPVGGGDVNDGWVAGGNTGNCVYEKFDGMSWSNGSSYMTKQRLGVKGGGPSNAGIAFGGCYPSVNHSTCTEELDGVTWSEVNDMSTAKGKVQGGWGEQVSAMSVGGDSSPGSVVEEYDGLNWSNQIQTPVTITQCYDGVGTANAGGQFLGTSHTPAPSFPNYYWNEWNGVSWSEGAKNIHPAEGGLMFGKMDSAIAAGGQADSFGRDFCRAAEEFDGTTWANVADMNVGFYNNTGGGIGSSGVAGVVTGGCSQKSDYIGTTKHCLPAPAAGYHEGSSNRDNSSIFERFHTCAVNLHSASIACTGQLNIQHSFRYPESGSIDTEHHKECSRIGKVTTNTLQLKNNTDVQVEESFQLPIFHANPEVTSSAGEVWYNTAEEKLYFTYDINSWTEVSDLNQSRRGTSVAGHSGLALAAGGRIAPSSPYMSSCTELWEGISWTAVNALNEDQGFGGMAGTACAAILMSVGSAQGTEGNELWNGTNWSTGPDGGLGVYGAVATSGTANASIHTGGGGGSGQSCPETAEWNGSAFYAAADMPTGRAGHGQAGTQNAAYSFGGGTQTPPSAVQQDGSSVKYNGTSWSTDAFLPIGVRDGGGAGTSNAAIHFGGYPASSPYPNITNTYEYNGSAWSTVNSLNTARSQLQGDGSQSSLIVAAGFGGGGALSEQYTTTGIGCHCIGGV